MRMIDSRMIATGVLLVLTLASGLWLSLSGKPYSTAIFTIHKLIALGAVIVTGITINGVRAGAPMPVPAVIALIAAALLIVSLAASGALLSTSTPENGMMLLVHRFAPPLAVISISAALYLLISARS